MFQVQKNLFRCNIKTGCARTSLHVVIIAFHPCLEERNAILLVYWWIQQGGVDGGGGLGDRSQIFWAVDIFGHMHKNMLKHTDTHTQKHAHIFSLSLSFSMTHTSGVTPHRYNKCKAILTVDNCHADKMIYNVFLCLPKFSLSATSAIY